MSKMITRVNGVRVTFFSNYHTSSAMETIESMLINEPNLPIYEIFQQATNMKNGSVSVGFVRDRDAAREYAKALGRGYDYDPIRLERFVLADGTFL